MVEPSGGEGQGGAGQGGTGQGGAGQGGAGQGGEGQSGGGVATLLRDGGEGQSTQPQPDTGWRDTLPEELKSNNSLQQIGNVGQWCCAEMQRRWRRVRCACSTRSTMRMRC